VSNPEQAPEMPVPAVSEAVLRAVCEAHLGLRDFHGRKAQKGGGLLAHRLFRWLVRMAAQGVREPSVQGGLTSLAKQLGATGSKAATRLRGVLDDFQEAELSLPHGNAPLLQWTHLAAGPGQPATLRIKIDDSLGPLYVVTLPKGTVTQREAKRLVPIPDRLPLLIKNERTHAAQALLQLLVLMEMRAHAEELAETGYVRIPGARWAAMAREAGLNPLLLGPLLDAWAAPGPEAFLARSAEDGELFGLADGYAKERDFLNAAGRKEKRGRMAHARRRKR
jgi:hypothetical protein